MITVPEAFSAELYLVKEGKTSKIVFTSATRVRYEIKEPSNGVVHIILRNVRLKRLTRRKLSDPVIKSIEIKPLRDASLVVVTLLPTYYLQVKESYPPFKLVFTPAPLSQQQMIKTMLKRLYSQGKCSTFLANFGRLSVARLTRKEAVAFYKMRLNCAEDERYWNDVVYSAEMLMRLVTDDKERESIWLKKIKALFASKMYEETLAEGKLFIDKYKDYNADLAGAYMAEAMIKLGRIDDAIILLKNLIKLHPDSPYLSNMYKALAKAYYLKSNFLASYMLMDKVYLNNRKLAESDSEAMFVYGNSAYRLGFKGKAKKILERTFNLHPSSKEAAKALAVLGQIFADRGNWKVAEWFFRQCIRMFPNSKAAAISKIKLAEHYESLGRYREALNLYTEAEILYPNMPKIIEVALYKKGLMLLRLGKYEEAIQTFKDFILRVPQSRFVQDAEKYIEEAEFLIAKRAYKQKRLEEAVKLLTQFAVRYPQNPHTKEAIELAGKALVEIVEDKYTRKDCAGILLFWDTYRNFFPMKVKSGLVTFHIAKCMLNNFRQGEAIQLFEWIEKNLGLKFPKRKELLSYLASYYFDRQDFKKAKEIAEELVSISTAKEFPEIHMRLLKLYFTQGEYKKMLDLSVKMEKEKAPRKMLVYIFFLRALKDFEEGNRKGAYIQLRLFAKKKLALLEYPDRYQYAIVMLARMDYNDNNVDLAYKRYLWYFNAFPRGRYTDEALFMLGYISEKMRETFWNLCLKRYPNSHWSKEIRALRLAEEIYHEARGAAGNPSFEGSS